MSFGLKNAGATYQRAIQQCLHDEIRDDLVEAYVDDVVVKTRDASTLIDNLDRTFKAPNKYKWKLNPKNASSGFPLVYCSVTSSAATAYGQTPQKSRRCSICDDQERQRRPKTHGVHGCSQPVYLQAGEKGLPFFRLLKASEKFSWTEEANAAFTQPGGRLRGITNTGQHVYGAAIKPYGLNPSVASAIHTLQASSTFS